MSDVYYRILITEEEPFLEVVHMQPFDERDYDQSKFFCKTIFLTEAEAKEVIKSTFAWLGHLILTKKICIGTPSLSCMCNPRYDRE